MTDDRRVTGQTIFPTLRYQDAAAAIDWLVAAFGFEKGTIVADDDGVVAHAELRFGGGTVMLGQRRDEHAGSPTDRQTIYVSVADIDAHHARALAAGADILSAPFDTDYGSRDYAARDLDGYRWDFGTYLPED